MSQMWHRMRGMVYPGPETGGIEQVEWDPNGDISPPEDNFSRLHNPQSGRVPPQLPTPPTRPVWPQFPTLQYERFFTTTPASLNRQLGFTAQSVRIDNYSSHWIFMVSIGMYPPPFNYGTVFLLQPGTNVANHQVQAPPNHADSSTLESLIVSIWYEQELMPVTGYLVPST